MTKTYGMPYMGSKSKIAERIIEALPSADCFVDLFGGGGAMTDCACQSGKYKRIIYNEINPLVYKAFHMAINGEFQNEKRWIDHETFMKIRKEDPYAAICFSFGGNLRSYAYSPENEQKIKQLHDLIFNKQTSCISTKLIPKGQRLENLQRLQRLNRLKHLGNGYNLEIYNLSYEQVRIPQNSVIYCDIPYRKTEKYCVKFDHDEFYRWAKFQSHTIFISEYEMPDDFVELKTFFNLCTFGKDKGKITKEKLFCNKNQGGLTHEN